MLLNFLKLFVAQLSALLLRCPGLVNCWVNDFVIVGEIRNMYRRTKTAAIPSGS